jgi:hypothetical protein
MRLPSYWSFHVYVTQTLSERVDAALAAEAENRRKADTSLRAQLLEELDCNRKDVLQRAENYQTEAEAAAQTLSEEVHTPLDPLYTPSRPPPYQTEAEAAAQTLSEEAHTHLSKNRNNNNHAP